MQASLVAQLIKNLPAMQDTQVRSLGWEDTLEKEMATHSVFLPGKSHGQRSLEGYSPCGCKSRTQLSALFFFKCFSFLFLQRHQTGKGDKHIFMLPALNSYWNYYVLNALQNEMNPGDTSKINVFF